VTLLVSATLPILRDHRLTTAVAWIITAWWGVRGLSDMPPASVYNRVKSGAPEVVPEGAEDAAAQAERIVASSLATIADPESVALKFRQKVRIGDRVLVGTGRYVQAGRGEEQRFRYDSMLTCDTESFEVTEVCDGLFCWWHRHLGEEAERLERVDVRRIRSRLAELGVPDAADGAAYLGGLQRSLRLVRHWFRFTRATSGDLEGHPVWLVEGVWPPHHLGQVLPDLAPRIAGSEGVGPADLPDGVPWQVRFWIGRGDLLPRRVEWLAIPGIRPVADAPLEPIAVLDFHDISINGPVDATAFFYQPATTGLVDVTEMHVSGLGPMR